MSTDVEVDAVDTWAAGCDSIPELQDADNRLAAVDEYLARTSKDGPDPLTRSGPGALADTGTARSRPGPDRAAGENSAGRLRRPQRRQTPPASLVP